VSDRNECKLLLNGRCRLDRHLFHVVPLRRLIVGWILLKSLGLVGLLLLVVGWKLLLYRLGLLHLLLFRLVLLWLRSLL
jgi:hypothetical protein